MISRPHTLSWSSEGCGFRGRKRIGERRTHDGQAAIFYEDRFDHAFFTSVDRTSRQFNKGRFDRLRGARVNWIGKMIAGEIENTECWLIPPEAPGGNPSRLYVLWEEAYVVWLLPRKDGGWRFSTAYVSSRNDLRRKTRYGRLMWRKKIPCD